MVPNDADAADVGDLFTKGALSVMFYPLCNKYILYCLYNMHEQ
jgi:hypothetical protein